MSPEFEPEVVEFRDRLEKEAEEGGYHLNPDREMTLMLAEGLLVNRKRHGYLLCPCRMGEGDMEKDLDIICPCDYRDADLEEYGQCYCALYVSRDVLEGKREIKGQIPERRPDPDEMERKREEKRQAARVRGMALPVWRCRVCGYLAAREKPPEVCPVCKAGRERFEEFPL